jgi:CRP/FNR family transcriptional regulator, dissimilatory nitrate respiration regulator
LASNVIDILHDCKLFTQVPQTEFKRLATMARLCHFRKGHLIFQEDDPCPGVYIVGSGAVRVFKRGSGGKEHVLHMVGPGDTFAEVAAIGGFNVPASAEAVSKTTCVLLPADLFRKALEENLKLCRGMMLGLTAWVRHLITLMGDIVLRDSAGRIARYLLEIKPLADGTVKLPGLKRHIASHLNLTSETFSRTFRRLIDAGLIAEAKNNKVKLVDPKALRRVAEGLYPKL